MEKTNKVSVTILKSAYEEKAKRNTSYSLRAFARDLDISPSYLCEVINDQIKLSAAMACRIAIKLNFSEDLFVKFVKSTIL